MIARAYIVLAMLLACAAGWLAVDGYTGAATTVLLLSGIAGWYALDRLEEPR